MERRSTSGPGCQRARTPRRTSPVSVASASERRSSLGSAAGGAKRRSRGRGARVLALVALGLASACSRPEARPAEPEWPRPARGAVVSEHPLATKVGLAILDGGGNAADAAVATALALAVVYPQAGNLGGGGFALWVPHTGEAVALDFRETAPAAADARKYVDAAGQRVPERSLAGPFAVAIPGSPAGLFELYRAHGSGRFTFADLVAPAVKLAREGFEVDAWLARDLETADAHGELGASAKVVLFPRGRLPREGEKLVQADLARTLEAFGDAGPSAFYTGRIADLIVRTIAGTRVPAEEAGGEIGDGSGAGWITLDDLAGYRAKTRKPLSGWFRGMEIVTMPPPSAGGCVLLHVLGVLEGLPLDDERDDARAQAARDAQGGVDAPPLPERMAHWWIEALRGAFADRAAHLGDPDFVDVPLDRLLGAEWIASRRVDIGERARPHVAPWAPPREGGETTHLSVLDSRGNAVSLTTTLNTTFGSGVLVEGAGFLLNDEMDDFALVEGSANTYGLVGGAANALRPGKRPLSSMTPLVVRDGGHANVLVLGSPGGPRITTAVLQVLLRVLVLEEPLAAAVRAPRLHQQWNPSETVIEPGFDPAVATALEKRRGHVLRRSPTRFASVQAIQLVSMGAEPIVVSDPRRGGVGGVQGRPTSVPARPPPPVPAQR